MNQAEIGKLVSSLRFKVQPKLIKTNSGGDGPRGRLIVYRNSVTALINNERLDLIHNVLLSEAKREKRLGEIFKRDQSLKEPTLDSVLLE